MEQTVRIIEQESIPHPIGMDGEEGFRYVSPDLPNEISKKSRGQMTPPFACQIMC